MSTKITGKNLELTDCLKEAVENTIEHIKKFNVTVNNPQVILSHHMRKEFTAELILQANDKTIAVSATKHDMYLAILYLGEKTIQVLKKQKEKARADLRESPQFDLVDPQADEVDSEEQAI